MSGVVDGSYRVCWSVDDWCTALREAEGSQDIGLDFETCPDGRRQDTTSALRAEDHSRIAGIGIAWTVPDGTIRSAYVGIRHERSNAGGAQPDAAQVTRALSDMIERRRARPDTSIVVANLGMELGFMLGEGIAWPARGQVQDVQIAARVLNKTVGPFELIGLKELQETYLKRDMTSVNDLNRWLKSKRLKPGRDIWIAPVALVGIYCQDDARDTLELWLRWRHLVYHLPTQWWWARPPDRSTRHDLYEMEVEAGVNAILAGLRGTRIDLSLARRKGSAAEALQAVVTRWIRDRIGVPTLNPGSGVQVQGIFFGPMKFKVSLAHLTDSFKKLGDREQAAVLAGPEMELTKWASLDIDALDHYAQEYPEHADLLFMFAVYRKCTTAMSWFIDRVLEFGILPCPDPWWGEHDSLLHLVFHRLRTVGTLGGRMSSSDYNGQQVPKRFKMLLDAERLIAILSEYLPPSQREELVAMMDFTEAAKGDESKALRIAPGHKVIDLSIRRMFIPRPGMNMRLFDLSQVEMRGFANISGNELLCGGYGTPPSDAEITRRLKLLFAVGMGQEHPCAEDLATRFGRGDDFDIHKFVADQLGISRKEAKAINFGIVYGMGKRKLARSMGWSIDKGTEYLANYHAKLPEIRLVQGKIKSTLAERGYIFDSFGRRYHLPVSRAYVGLNRLIQGWAASAFKTGFVRFCDLARMPRFGAGSVDPVIGRPTWDGVRPLTCIHDELMSEVHVELDDETLDWAARSSMTLFHGLKVPLESASEWSSSSWDEAVPVAA